MSLPAVKTAELTKRFGTRRWPWSRDDEGERTALNRVSLEIQDGEVFGLLGLNGAGKTTLVRMLSTLLIPTSGEGWIFGESLTTRAHAVRGMIGLVTADERSFYWRLTGRQNLNFVAGVYSLPPREAERRIDELSDALGLRSYLDERFSGYSTGMRQMLAIARGLLMRPRLLFLDEPTKGLDPLASLEFLTLIGQEVIPRYKITALITTHILREAELLCDRIAILHGGTIVACDSPQGIQKSLQPAEIYDLRVRGLAAADLEPLRAVRGVLACDARDAGAGCTALELRIEEDSEALAPLLRLLAARPLEILACSQRTKTLEESFAQIVRALRDVDALVDTNARPQVDGGSS